MTNCNKCGRPVGGSSMYCSACYDEMEQNARLDFENTQLRARTTKLEAAQQWHPASEPPEEYGYTKMSRAVLIQEKSGDCYTDWYDHDINRWHFSKHIVRWRELPPLPEVEA